jgi:hypothetical protein
VSHGLSVRKEKKRIAKKSYTAPIYGAHVGLKVFLLEKKRKQEDHGKERDSNQRACAFIQTGDVSTTMPTNAFLRLYSLCLRFFA